MTVAAFANAVPNGFVWIDHWQVESGGLIAPSFAQLWSAFRQPLGSIPGWDGPAPYARPLVIAVLSLVHAVAGLDPAAYHLALVGMHLANVLLVYSVLLALTAAPAVAFFTAAIFALHPLQTAAVSWISGIADPLCALFLLLAFRLQLASSQRPARGLLLRLGAVLSFALALGAKETALMFPVLLAAAYLLLSKDECETGNGKPEMRNRRIGCRRIGPFPISDLRFPVSHSGRPRLQPTLAPFVLLVAADFAYRHLVLGGSALGGGFGRIPLIVRLWTAPRLLLSYLTLPLRLNALTVCDDYALSTGLDPASLAAAGPTTALLLGVVFWCRRWPQLGFAVLWMLATLLPALNLVPILHYRADRFFYLPLIGWSLAAVTVVQELLMRVSIKGDHTLRDSPRTLRHGAKRARLLRRDLLRVNGNCLLESIIQPLALRSRLLLAASRRAPAGEDRQSLNATFQRVSVRFRRVAAGAGLAVLVLLGFLTVRRNALFADDRTLFEATVRMSPFCREAHTALGDAYLRAGLSDDAVVQYQLALGAQPDRASYVVLPKVLINLGMAQLMRRDYAAAEEAFQQAHHLQPHLLHPLFGLGISNLALGRVSTAVGWLKQAYEHDPMDPDVSFNLALGYDRLGQAADATAMYRHYLDVAPRGRARGLAEERLRVLGQAR